MAFNEGSDSAELATYATPATREKSNMKNRSAFAVLLVLLSFCTVAAEPDRPAVTFIELGSVNCIPCKMMQPVMKKAADKYPGQVKVVFHDVWTAQGQPFARQYKIKAIPTQVFLDKSGKEYARHVGFFDFDGVEKVLREGGVK